MISFENLVINGLLFVSCHLAHICFSDVPTVALRSHEIKYY